MSVPTRVLILGAGYAGLMAANRIAGRFGEAEHVTITLLNPVADFVERIRLHELAAGTRETAVVPMSSLLHERVDPFRGTAARIDAERRLVYLTEGGEPLAYDVLLYGVGSVQGGESRPDGALTLRDPAEARRVRERLSSLAAGSCVTVIGAGLTGIELSTEIAERHPHLRVRILTRGTAGDDLSPAGKRSLLRRMRALGIELAEHTEVWAIDDRLLTLADGRTLPSACTVWTAGFSVPDLARASGLPVDESGRLLVDQTLTCTQYPTVFGAGDAVRAPREVAGQLRMSCAAALPMGAHAADSIIARMTRHEPTALSAGFVLRCVSLGRRAGLIQGVYADDRVRRIVLRCRTAALLKERVCQMTLSWIRGERRRSGSFTWPAGPGTTR
ncbi:dehydrogenase [Mycetocola tolaasinivorans]|uniref:Dehydrogenase n=1 Tax=Mycetocola tolaasinivorans TaxID=76635 RepID=A0A3L7A9W5_9MICO|nr:FAD-dependent oxidoreductase [Mycetocola tolaasinivorans]RLP76987.1 dehydrogenase [Mycetocola tolaasinivorans]